MGVHITPMIGGRVVDVRHQRCKKCVQLDNIIAFEHISVAFCEMEA